MQNPKCSECGADSTKFLTRLHSSARGTLVLLFCNECGTVQGVTTTKE